MHVWIDGYNFLFRIIPQEADLKTNREALIEQFVEFAEGLSQAVTIVFDAQYQSSESLRKHQGALEIIFTPQDEIADDFLIRKFSILNNPKTHLLVTSDMKLAWRARQEGVKTETVEEFLRRYRKRQMRAPREKLEAPAVAPLKKREPIPGTIEYYLKIFDSESFSDRTKSDYERWLEAFNEDEK